MSDLRLPPGDPRTARAAGFASRIAGGSGFRLMVDPVTRSPAAGALVSAAELERRERATLAAADALDPLEERRLSAHELEVWASAGLEASRARREARRRRVARVELAALVAAGFGLGFGVWTLFDSGLLP